MSAVVHGQNWALIRAGFELDRAKGIGSPIVAVELKPKIASYLCNKAAYAFLRPVWLWCEFVGIDRRPLKDKVERPLAILGIRISER